jgi:hypothetical protein
MQPSADTEKLSLRGEIRQSPLTPRLLIEMGFIGLIGANCICLVCLAAVVKTQAENLNLLQSLPLGHGQSERTFLFAALLFVFLSLLAVFNRQKILRIADRKPGSQVRPEI